MDPLQIKQTIFFTLLTEWDVLICYYLCKQLATWYISHCCTFRSEPVSIWVKWGRLNSPTCPWWNYTSYWTSHCISLLWNAWNSTPCEFHTSQFRRTRKRLYM